MGGWGIGWRIYTGITHSIERKEETDENNDKITIRFKRTVTLERAEYRGLTKTNAEQKTATSGWTITARERVDETNQWRVTEEKETKGIWTIDTDPE